MSHFTSNLKQIIYCGFKQLSRQNKSYQLKSFCLRDNSYSLQNFQRLNCIQSRFFSSTKSNEQDPEDITKELESFKKKMEAEKPKKSSVTEEQLQELSGYESFNSGSKYASQEQFSLAESQFSEVLQELNEKQPERIDLQLIVMKRIALMMKIQEKNTLLTPLLEDLYFKHLAFYSWKNQDFPKILKNLLTHYCIYDLDRGSLFLEMLLEQMKTEQMPQIILRDIYLYAGIIHILRGEDFNQGERFLQESLKAGLHPIQKGIAYNNLACATYWNCLKLLLELSQTPKENAEQAKKLQEEITERIELVSPLLKRAFNAFEFEEKHRQKDQINETQFVTLKKLFDESKTTFDLAGIVLLVKSSLYLFSLSQKPEEILLKNPMSTVCAMNMGEFLFYSGDFASSQFWLQVSQYSSTKVDSLARVLRTIVLSAQAAKKQAKPEFSEELLIDCLEYSENYTTYNKVFALESYSSLLKQLGRNYEGEDYLNQAEELKKRLNYWDERKENILIPEYDFKF